MRCACLSRPHVFLLLIQIRSITRCTKQCTHVSKQTGYVNTLHKRQFTKKILSEMLSNNTLGRKNRTQKIILMCHISPNILKFKKMIYGKSPLGTWSSLIFHSMSIGWILDRERDPRPHVIFDPLAITKWSDSAKSPTTLSGIFDFYTRAIHLWFAKLLTSIFGFIFSSTCGDIIRIPGEIEKVI